MALMTKYYAFILFCLRAGSYSSTGTQPIALVKLGFSQVPKPLPFNSIHSMHSTSAASCFVSRKGERKGKAPYPSGVLSIKHLGIEFVIGFTSVYFLSYN